jgi:hypothetical protein
MRLVNSFSRQLNGDLQVLRKNPGTEFVLTMDEGMGLPATFDINSGRRYIRVRDCGSKRLRPFGALTEMTVSSAFRDNVTQTRQFPPG